MGGSTLRTLICALALAGAVSAQRYPVLRLRLDTNTSSSSVSATNSQSASSSRSSSTSRFSSSSFSSTPVSTSSSTFSSSSSTPSSSSTTSSSSSTTTTSVITISSQPSSSSSSVSSSSIVPSSTSRTSAVLVKPTAALATPSSQTSDVVPDLTSSTDDQPSATDSAKSNVNAASSGFWGNKGAVGATFAVVALVVIGALLGFIAVLRRRAAKHNSARDTFFDTKNPIDQAERQPSPEPSMRSLGNEPMDAHATPMANYGHTDQYLVDTTDYNVSYPPGAAYVADPNDSQQYYTGDYTDPSAQQQQQQQYYQTGDQHYPDQGQAQAYYAENNAYENYNQHYAADPGTQAQANGYSVSPANQRPSLSPHPYSHPSHASASAVPPAMRDLAGRDSYQPSIDSFYGAAGTAL